MNTFNKIAIFFKEIRLEIKKVNWPTKNEIIRYTLIVLGISIATALFLGTFDFVFSTILTNFVL